MPAKGSALGSGFAGIDVDGVDFTIGVEAANVINVGLQLKLGSDLANRGAVDAYLSDDANGDSVIASAQSSSPAIGTDGVYLPIIADKMFKLISESDGDIDIDFTETGTKTVYLVVVLPGGALVVSGAITHAA